MNTKNEKPSDFQLHRSDFEGAEQLAYDRGWLDGCNDAGHENLVAGTWHGLVVGAALAATIATAIHLWWPS